MQATIQNTTRRAQRTTVIKSIASEIQRLKHCIASDKDHFAPAIESAETRLDNLEHWLPSGSGIDCGTKIDIDASSATKIVLTFSYHHMNENGMHDGWSDHRATIRPMFDGFDITISGSNRNDIKDYLYDTFHCMLTQDIDVFADDSVECVAVEQWKLWRNNVIDFQI